MPIVKRNRTYYKYGNVYTVDLGSSDNSSYISNGKFVVNIVSNFMDTQTYILNSAISAKELYFTVVGDVQANAGWTTTIIAITNIGNKVVYSNDFGYGVNFSDTHTEVLSNNVTVSGFMIYAHCYRSSTSYVYGSIEIGIGGKPSNISTSSDYDYFEDELKYYTLARKVRKYYKWVTWTQPVATGEVTVIVGGDMIITASNYNSNRYPWKALDGVKSGTDASTGWGVNGTTATQWWQLKLPSSIKITGLNGYQRYDASPARSNTIGRFYTNSAKSTPIGNTYTNNVGVNWNTVSVSGIPSSGILTDTIFFEKTGGSDYGGLGEIEIIAQVSQESTSADYDYFEDVLEYYTLARKVGATFKGY